MSDVLRIAHLSDNHFDAQLRLDDCVRIHAAFRDQIRERRVDVVLDAGDFFERRSVAAERNAFADWLSGLVADGVLYYGVRGNHDEVGDLDLFNYVLGDRGHIQDFDEEPVVIAEDDDSADGSARWAIVGLPWISRAAYIKGAQGSTRAMLDHLALIGESLRERGRVPILVAHAELAGYTTGLHKPQGSTLALDPNDRGFVPYAYGAFGHVHQAQAFAGGRLRYSGSPDRNDFGEQERKGWLYVELDLDRAREDRAYVPTVEFVELPTRRMVDLTVDDPGDDFDPALLAAAVEDGDLVRVRVRASSQYVSTIKPGDIEAKLRAYGAHTAQVEVIPAHTDRVRSEEIRTATTTWEQALAFWRSKADVPDEETQVRLHAELDEIEREVANDGR